MTTSGSSENGDIIFPEGDESDETLPEQHNRLYQVPSVFRRGGDGTGSLQQSAAQQPDTGTGGLTEQQRTEREKQSFWRHARTLAYWFVFGLLALGIAFLAWYIPHSNNNAAKDSEILTEIENLKIQINQLREDKNRDIDELRRRIETIQNGGVNNNL